MSLLEFSWTQRVKERVDEGEYLGHCQPEGRFKTIYDRYISIHQCPFNMCQVLFYDYNWLFQLELVEVLQIAFLDISQNIRQISAI